MAVSLLYSESGCSLEFSVSDIERVRAALERHYGKPAVNDSSPFMTVYSFAKAKLAFQNEWDDPCLIANDATGVAMLEHIAIELTQAAQATQNRPF
ncbi:MAG: hypothetical protein JHC81_04060 [Brevundimonas sp.]|uniref:hypothetical protein n=1 Tax=Brevundimonas sp. TaxID=1871086 RepID=UPI001A319DF0|nr:hypothetical protein [Brevundimonas sp.]MBJ7446688.1 hypothetical protein [Brevundimonas sp.]